VGAQSAACSELVIPPCARHAEELLQEVLVELWRGGDSFRGESKESTFVIGCARNVLRRFRKNRKDELQKKGHCQTAQSWRRSAMSDRARPVGERNMTRRLSFRLGATPRMTTSSASAT
jgi:DNA-directed RNA polymerase specialized sigma24 family protein